MGFHESGFGNRLERRPALNGSKKPKQQGPADVNPSNNQVILPDGQLIRVANEGVSLLPIDGGLFSGGQAGLDAIDRLRKKATNPRSSRNLDKIVKRFEGEIGRRAAAVNRSSASQRDTISLNKLVSSGRKRTRGGSVAIPRSRGLTLGLDDRDRLLL